MNECVASHRGGVRVPTSGEDLDAVHIGLQLLRSTVLRYDEAARPLFEGSSCRFVSSTQHSDGAADEVRNVSQFGTLPGMLKIVVRDFVCDHGIELLIRKTR